MNEFNVPVLPRASGFDDQRLLVWLSGIACPCVGIQYLFKELIWLVTSITLGHAVHVFLPFWLQFSLLNR